MNLAAPPGRLSKPVKGNLRSFDSLNRNSIIARIVRDKYLFLLFLPGMLYYLIFKYAPMFGVVIAFQKFDIIDGFFDSKWVGLKNFITFIEGPFFWKLIRNTIILNMYNLICSFPAPIILALVLNEIKNMYSRRFVQTVTYMPHFISTVVIVGVALDFLSPTSGKISLGLAALTNSEPIFFLAKPEYFRIIYVLTEVWRNAGWGAIIYIAALSNIDPALYEAATVDGANRWQRLVHITLPGIVPVIIIVFILRLGHILDVGFEMVYLMQNSMNLETSDVISTFVYRRGILGERGTRPDYSFAAAVNLFQSAIGFIMVITANKISNKVSEVGLW